MPAKAYLRILQAGLIGSLLIVFFVFQDLLFPYITSKQLSFNILMELLFVVWLVFIWRYPAYRPRRNFITYGLLAYFLAILASIAVSVNPTLSFWGNAERMLGLFHLLHFLIFYLILITVFRTWAEWRTFFGCSVLAATAVSLYGWFGPNPYSTIGNTAYVSGYLIFNLFFCLILFGRSQARGWRWLYAVPAGIMLVEFWSCHTSGAIIGLGLSLLVLFFLLGLFHSSKTRRRLSLIVFGLFLLALVVVFSQRQADWFQNSFLRNLTVQKNTFQTRLISWRGAAADFKNHPIFGTGFGNYAIIFDKHFDSTFFNYSRTETYFDRAHNNLIDITSTTGLVGLITYLSIFVFIAYYLGRLFRQNGGLAGTAEAGQRRNLEVLVIVALLVAYFIQNLAVFDSYVTYIGLMLILGFIYWLNFSPAEEESALEEEPWRFALSPQWEWLTLIILIFGAYLFANQYNIRPWQMFRGVINGYSNIMGGKLIEGVLAYQQALVGTPLDHDGRGTLVNLTTANPGALDSLTPQQAQTILDYVISLARQNVAENPQDSLGEMQLAQILDTAARYNYQNLAKFNEYSGEAIQAINRSIEASPGRAPVYLVKAQMLLFRGDTAESLQTVQYAISLNPDYFEGYCRLSQFYMFLKDQKLSAVKDEDLAASLNKCLDLGGGDEINSPSLLAKALSFYATINDYPHALKLAERLAALNSSNPQVWFSLAKLYWLSGDQAAAQGALRQATTIDPKLQADWDAFLKTVNSLKASSTKAIPVK